MAHNWGNSTRSARLPSNWREIRARVLRRDRERCQIHLEGCTVKATEVDHFGADPDDHRIVSLRAACSSCNARRNYQTRARPKRLSTKRPPERHPGLTT